MLIGKAKTAIFLGLDLSSQGKSWRRVEFVSSGPDKELEQARCCAVDAATSADDVSSLRGSLRRRVQEQCLLVPGPVSEHGFCAADLVREFARHRGLPAQRSKLNHLGIRSLVARNTLAKANAVRDWRIYVGFGLRLNGIARDTILPSSIFHRASRQFHASAATQVTGQATLSACEVAPAVLQHRGGRFAHNKQGSAYRACF